MRVIYANETQSVKEIAQKGDNPAEMFLVHMPGYVARDNWALGS